MKARLIIGLVIALFSIISYFSSSSVNTITGEKQHIRLTPEQEIALGLQSAPQMAQEMGGLSNNAQAQALVKKIGQRVVANSVAAKSPYKFDFHLLADPETINAFALPGGQIFITVGLLKLLRTEGELAGVLGHEVGHVVARHSAEHMAKAGLTQGLTNAAVIAADPTGQSSGMAQMISSAINMKYGRDDELEADALGVRLGGESGYDPRAMLGVMEILNKAGSGRGRPPEMFSSHPNPENRAEKIKELIATQYPNGIPRGLTP
ncbi:MAG: M48 family metalloprotease [Burkholderiales bacterium]